jgi:DNA-binding Lrp family transcriptional regulator
MARALDDRDRRILALLQADAWLTYPALGDQVNLSASAAQRRVERMIRDGVILGARAQIAAIAPMKRVVVYLLAELADESTATIEQLSTALSAVPEVVEAYYVVGEADVALRLEFADIGAYDLFLERHVNRSPAIARFKTLVVLRTLKPSGWRTSATIGA